MNKTTSRGLLLVLVLLVAFSVISFVIPFEKTAVFWLSYVCGVAAILVQVYVMLAAFPEGGSARSRFYGFPIARVGVIYLAVQLVLSVVFMALSGVAPAWIAVVVYILLLAAALTGFISVDITRDEIERQDAALKKDVSSMRALQSKTAALSDVVRDSQAAQEIHKLAEAFRYSDPVSSEPLRAIESELAAYVDELQKAVTDGDAESIVALSKKAGAVLAERNRLCKLNKSSAG